METFLSGSISGIAQTTVGYPFDTLKVRLQNNTTFHNTTFRSLFRGIYFPLVSNTIVNAVLFSSQESIQKFINYKNKGSCYNCTHKKDTNNTNNTIIPNFFSGFISGALISPIVYFFDIGKTLKQMNKQITLSNFITRRGYVSVLLRESIAYGTYFSVYKKLRDEKISPFVSGGISGLCNWTITYPLDVLRNRQIVNNITWSEAYNMGHLWRGYSICALRAVLVNSVGFYVYEECKKNIQLRKEK